MAFLNIHIDKIKENWQRLHRMTEEQDRRLVAVSKVIQSYPPLLEALESVHPGIYADTHVSSLQNTRSVISKLSLLNPSPRDISPQMEGITSVYMADPVLIRRLSNLNLQPKPRIILSVEAGGLREGLPEGQVIPAVKQIRDLPGVEFQGIGTTFGCLLGLFPEDRDLDKLCRIQGAIENRVGIPCPTVSVGGTILLDRLREKSLPDRINEIRLGEAVFFGYNTFRDEPLPGFQQDCFTLTAEAYEPFLKNTNYQGDFGHNVFGTPGSPQHRLINCGLQNRALVDAGASMFGKLENITPLDPVDVLASSYEISVITWDDSMQVETGTPINFSLNYDAVSQAVLNTFLTTRVIPSKNSNTLTNEGS